MGNICEQCGCVSKNEFAACAGAIAQEYDNNLSFTGLDTNGMISCNCCDSCREICKQSYIEDNELTQTAPATDTGE